MTMDLWYDLAVRELPESDEELIQKLHFMDGLEPAQEPEAAAVTAADFF